MPTLPRTNKKLINKYDESFIVKGANLWNALPPPLTRSKTLLEFKKALKLHLRTVPDRPPIPGYSSGDGNSLAEIKS